MSYITDIGEQTYKATSVGVYSLVCRHLLAKESNREFTGELASAICLRLWDDPPTDKRHVEFKEQNLKRIEEEFREPYFRTSELQEILSRAAYNIGYGRYVASGGGRLLNKYLGYIRSDSILSKSASDWKANTGLYSDLTNLSLSILRPIQSLKHWSLWRPRPSNPNEQDYYQSVSAFAVREHDLLKKMIS